MQFVLTARAIWVEQLRCYPGGLGSFALACMLLRTRQQIFQHVWVFFYLSGVRWRFAFKSLRSRHLFGKIGTTIGTCRGRGRLCGGVFLFDLPVARARGRLVAGADATHIRIPCRKARPIRRLFSRKLSDRNGDVKTGRISNPSSARSDFACF